MKALHSIPNEFKSKKAAQKANFVFPVDVARGIAKWLSGTNMRLRVVVSLGFEPDDYWHKFTFQYRYNYPYARWRFLNRRTIQYNAERWSNEEVDNERIEIIYA